MYERFLEHAFPNARVMVEQDHDIHSLAGVCSQQDCDIFYRTIYIDVFLSICDSSDFLGAEVG